MERDSLIALFRDAVRARADRISVRAIAGEIGMSASGVQNLVNRSTRPNAQTLDRLRSWYLRAAARGDVPVSVAGAHYIGKEFVALSLSGLPDHEQTGAANELLMALVGIYHRRGLDPSWVVNLLGATTTFRSRLHEATDDDLLALFLREAGDEGEDAEAFFAILLRYREYVRGEMEAAGLSAEAAEKRVGTVFVRALDPPHGSPQGTSLRERLTTVSRQVAADLDWSPF